MFNTRLTLFKGFATCCGFSERDDEKHCEREKGTKQNDMKFASLYVNFLTSPYAAFGFW